MASHAAPAGARGDSHGRSPNDCGEKRRGGQWGSALFRRRVSPHARPGVSPDDPGHVRCNTESVKINPGENLVVDDHDIFRACARKMLETARFTVAEAASGAEATQTARMAGPWLVLLEIVLSGIDGFEVASPIPGFLPKDQLSGAALRGFLAGSLP
jgi:hypothetical protein